MLLHILGLGSDRKDVVASANRSLLALLLEPPTDVIGGLVQFNAQQGENFVTLMLVGLEDSGAFHCNWKEPSTPSLPNLHRHYYIELDLARRQAYAHPLKRHDLPPLEMDGLGDRSNVLIGGRRVRVCAGWTIQQQSHRSQDSAGGRPALPSMSLCKNPGLHQEFFV